ncbi:MAG: hypothetical protein WKF75_14485, partial [Singulisphaera sp.]
MGKRDNQSRDQRRKAKLKKRAERSRKHESLAYAGGKYKTDEYAPIFYRTEVGIYESYVMCDRELADIEVERAIERLVIRMREGPLPPLSEAGVLRLTEGGEEEFLIANIRRNWRVLEAQGALPGRDDLIGLLRTILHSIEVWRSQSLHSQGYLRYIEGFMKKLGVSVRQATPDFKPLPEPEEDPLLLIGRTWVAEGEETAGPEFADGVESSLRTGEAGRVIDVCQQLLGETEDMSVVPRLQEYAVR